MSTYSLRRQIRSNVAATALLVISMAAPSAKAATPGQQSAGASRAEIVADLNLWKRAKVDQFVLKASYGRGEDDEEFAAAMHEYRRMRNGPEFTREVTRVKSGQRGPD